MQERLAGKALLLTGASGFVGKAVLGPDRARAAGHAASPCCCAATPSSACATRCSRAPRSRASTAAASQAISGDLGDDGLEGVGGIDVVIHCAASVSFEQALDEALELNGKGPARLLERAARGRQRPVLHPRLAPPTPPACAPGSCSSGRPAPRRREPWLDLDAELDAARAWRRDIEAESRLPRAPAPLRQGGRARGRPRRRPGHRRARRAAALRVGPRPAHRARPRARPRARLVATPTRSRKAIGERTLIAAEPARSSRSSARRSSSPRCTRPTRAGWSR